MFWIIKKIFILLLTGLANGSNHTKCSSLSNQKFMTLPTLINMCVQNKPTAFVIQNWNANVLKVSAVIPLFFPNSAALARRSSLNRESTLIGGGMGRIVWDDRFFSILLFLGVRSNYYTNRLKSRLSFPRFVDDYPSNGTKFS